MNEKYSQEWLQNRIAQNQTVARGQVVWWMFINYQGKWRIIGWKVTEDMAEREAYEVARGNEYKVLPFNTIDESQASRLFKGYLLEQSKNIGEATINLSHKRGEL